MAKGEKENAITMMTRLSDLLRRTLELPKKDLVTLEEELSLIRLYLDIQEVRFKDRLKISYQIDNKTYPAKIPVFILQPIIENAIVHGIEPYSDSGVLAISAGIHDNRLELRVEDDGAGIPKNFFREGIGLNNIRSRLKNYFKSDYTFVLESRQPKGTNAILNLPLIYN